MALVLAAPVPSTPDGLMLSVVSLEGAKAIVKLNWKGTEPGVDPFAALAGGDGQALVSVATCSAKTKDEVDNALAQLVARTSLLARRLVSGAERVLFLWDPVYAELAIMFTDETMYRDGPIVTKCKFPLLDEEHSALSRRDEDKWDLETARFSQHIREVLAREVASARFPGDLAVYFSDQDRESFTPEEFEAARVSSAWQRL